MPVLLHGIYWLFSLSTKRGKGQKEYLLYKIDEQKKSLDMALKAAMENPVLSAAEEEEKKKKGLAQIEKDLKNNPAWKEKAIKNYLANYRTSQQEKDEYIKTLKETSNKEIKFFQKELDKTPPDLIDSPAIVNLTVNSQMAELNQSKIFITEKEGGIYLVTENPDYYKKDLPRYVPQFMVLRWKWWGYSPETTVLPLAAPVYFGKRINENFPIEKLQAMIDK